MEEPTDVEIQQLGAALVKAIKTEGAWPMRLEIMDLKHEIVGFSSDDREMFRITIPGRWL